MFRLYADKTRLTVREKETVTSGSVNVFPVRFEFSADWDGLIKTAIFRAGTESREAALDNGGECVIPWEVLTQPGCSLFAGLRGKSGNKIILPTVWTSLGIILEGAAGGGTSLPPTPDLWEQELAQCRDHRLLSHRDAEKQHPIGAVEGLQAALDAIPAPVEALTNQELEELLK